MADGGVRRVGRVERGRGVRARGAAAGGVGRRGGRGLRAPHPLLAQEQVHAHQLLPAQPGAAARQRRPAVQRRRAAVLHAAHLHHGAGGPAAQRRVPGLREALRPREALRLRAAHLPPGAGHALRALPLLQALHGALPEDLHALPAR